MIINGSVKHSVLNQKKANKNIAKRDIFFSQKKNTWGPNPRGKTISASGFGPGDHSRGGPNPLGHRTPLIFPKDQYMPSAMANASVAQT